MAGRRPILLALIIMATVTIGLLLSGWLTPAPGRAQPGQPDPTPGVENTNCIATTNAWSGTCPAIITNSSVSPSTIYDPWKTAPTMPTNIVAPVYSPTNIFTQLVTYDSTNCDTVTNTENVTYSVSGVTWTNFSSPYTNFPSVVTDSFSAQAYVIVTSSDTNLCPSPGIVYLSDNISSASAAQTQAASDSSFIVWEPYGIIHRCVNSSPSKSPGVWRTDVGVGEKVNLSIKNLPANTSVQWDCGGVGSIDTPSQPTCVWTAPDSTGSPPGYYNLLNSSTELTKACTIKATFSINGEVETPSVAFTVYRPTKINMKFVYPEHTVNTCTIGMKTDVYLAPANVNFSAVTTREEAVDPIYGFPIYITGEGCYAGQNPHGTSVEVSLSTQVDDDLGTKASVSPTDEAYFQTPVGGLAVGTGDARGDIPNDWKCNSSAWNDNYCTSVETATSTAVQGQSGAYQLDVRKCGADYSCFSSDPTKP
jgi:hypothetical protein